MPKILAIFMALFEQARHSKIPTLPASNTDENERSYPMDNAFRIHILIYKNDPN